MAQLTVRELEQEVVQALEKWAFEQGLSLEELHRRILQNAVRPQGSSMKDYLLSMPAVMDTPPGQ